MIRSTVRGALCALAVAVGAGLSIGAPAALAQVTRVDPPSASYDPATPTVTSVLGYAGGERISRPADVRRYFEALRASSPDRMAMGEYATSHEGRPLFWAAVGSPRNIARLEEIKANARALADPRRTGAAEAQGLIADQPIILAMMYSVHGNEISPADAAMAAAHHLLASRDPAVQGWLANTVVVLMPTQNPDGRERFLNGFNAGFGGTANADPLSVERDEPWPGGRFNHDLFDLNRDWFAQTQPETRGAAALIREWRPQVVVDSHEMGTDQTFFFPPEAQPLNPLIAPSTLASRERIGRNTASRFDQAGVAYFNRQVFDAFYPGYGDGWPGYLGAVSMTYEQGSARGLLARRSSGEILTYAETVRNHLIATLSTIEAASRDHDRLLGDFYAYHAEGLAGRGAFILSDPTWDPGAADRLAGQLVASGVEVGRANAAFSACGKSYPAGSYIVNLAQPQRRMAEVLLDTDIAVPADFLAEQERRRARGLGDEIYDVTAWSLPLNANVPADRCGAAPAVAVTAATEDRVRPLGVDNPDAAYGWLVMPGQAGTRLMTAALRAGVPIRAADKSFTHDGRRWPSGTMIVTRAGAGDHDVAGLVSTWAAEFGAQVAGVDDSWVSDGPSFGSSDTPLIRAPRVALAWDDPINPTSAGAARYILEREFDYPVTVVRASSLVWGDLSGFQVLILPESGDYKRVLGEAGVTKLRTWVENGGTLITLGRATRLAADPASQMLASRRETAAGQEGAEAAGDKASVDGALIATEADYQKRVGGTDRQPDSVAGALGRVSVDGEHWLGAGIAPQLNVLVQGGDIYTPLRQGEGTNVARFTDADTLLASGQMWDQNRRQLAYKPSIMAAPQGRGQVIAFVQDPAFRGYMDGLKTIFMAAVLRGPAHAQPTWSR